MIITKKVSLKNGPNIRDLQEVNAQIYGELDDRYYDIWEIFSNQERFMMRAMKGIRKGDLEKLRRNIVIALSWFLAIMNRFHIDLEEAVWNRFPYLCSYCGGCPCICKKTKPTERPRIKRDGSKRPKSLAGFQEMFQKIYPSDGRNLEHAGIHLVEEQGEISEALQIFIGSHGKKHFQNIIDESSDYLSCVIGLMNSAGIDFEKEMLEFYAENCHACHNAPCTCDFNFIADFKS